MTGSSIVGTLYEVALQWEPALVLLGSACTTAGLLLVEAPDGALDTSRDHQEGMSGSDSVTGVLQTRILTGDGALHYVCSCPEPCVLWLLCACVRYVAYGLACCRWNFAG